jgi:hypothetical protein
MSVFAWQQPDLEPTHGAYRRASALADLGSLDLYVRGPFEAKRKRLADHLRIDAFDVASNTASVGERAGGSAEANTTGSAQLRLRWLAVAFIRAGRRQAVIVSPVITVS